MPRIVCEASRSTEGYLVCIAGCSQSGKSFAASRLSEFFASRDLSCDLLSMDDFWRPSDAFDFATVAEGFDHPSAVDFGLLADVLHRWQVGEDVRLPTLVYERTTTDIPRSRREWTGTKRLSPILIMEGLFAHYECVSRLASASLLIVGPPATVRLRRRLRRDTLERDYEEVGVRSVWETMAEPGCRQYVLGEGAMESCKVDYFVDGESHLPLLLHP